MTEIKCPNCGSMNRLSALQCLSCSMPFSSLPASAFVETETEQDRVRSTFGNEVYAPLSYRNTYEPPPNDIGQKTFFWYRVYCGVLAAIYVLLAAMGLFISYMAAEMGAQATENMILGLAYAIVGTIFFAVSIVASILPPKPYNWIVGIVMIALGFTSCCFWPAVIPLLIYWIKPETREFFGRK